MVRLSEICHGGAPMLWQESHWFWSGLLCRSMIPRSYQETLPLPWRLCGSFEFQLFESHRFKGEEQVPLGEARVETRDENSAALASRGKGF